MSGDFWRGRRVFITGHTGFKGSWLALVLHDLGAALRGYSLAPPSTPSLHDLARVHEVVDGIEADVRDLSRLRSALAEARPEVVFHLAAQSLVGVSYEEPVATFETNVMGTVHVLEAARTTPEVRAVVVVTSDKCYDDPDGRAHREDDPLGGRDPYSASKACAEVATGAYRRSLARSGLRIASVRAGNALGGGDWARDRLVPDVVRALVEKKTAVIRNPASVRPWQHVLDPLAGYLRVAQDLHADAPGADDAWNFGPGASSERAVSDLAGALCAVWGEGAAWRHEETRRPHEEPTLTLDATRARTRLGWAPRLDYGSTLAWTVEWYKAVAKGADARATTVDQIRRYRELARA